MKNGKENINDLIEKYFDGQLSQEEEKLLLDQVNRDKGEEAAFKFRKKVQDDLKKAAQMSRARQQVKGSILNYKRKRRYNRYYAIAAGLALLLAIPGIFTIVNRSDADKFASGDQDNVEVFQPEIKQPEEYANSGEYTEDISLISEIKNDTLYLSWQPALSDTSTLILLGINQKGKNRTEKIQPNANTFVLSTSDLSAGRYFWYIEGYRPRDTVLIK